MTNNWLDIIKEKFYFQEKKVPEQIWLNVQKNLPKVGRVGEYPLWVL